MSDEWRFTGSGSGIEEHGYIILIQLVMKASRLTGKRIRGAW